MPCPFLKSLSPAYVRNYGSSLVKQYGAQCPRLARAFRTLGDDETKCPFIQQNSIVSEAPREMTEDIDSRSGPAYSYDKFFNEQISAKKKDYSYRVFRKVSRLAAEGAYPGALEGRERRPVTVWCANEEKYFVHNISYDKDSFGESERNK